MKQPRKFVLHRDLPEGFNYFITSDMHFYHKNIMKFSPSTRPWKNTHEMNEALIEHWNRTVGYNDVVFHLGDFSFGNKRETEELISRLNGTIIWVDGNHDNVLDKIGVTENRHKYLEVRFNKRLLVLFHFPIREWNQKARGSMHFHGHSHGSLPHPGGRMLDVGFDALGEIVPLEEVVKLLVDVTEFYTEDHHKEGR